MFYLSTFFFFFFNDTATTEIYTLSLHDALPISPLTVVQDVLYKADGTRFDGIAQISWKSFQAAEDRKSTRLNSSHGYISYAVFCLKKKKKKNNPSKRHHD